MDVLVVALHGAERTDGENYAEEVDGVEIAAHGVALDSDDFHVWVRRRGETIGECTLRNWRHPCGGGRRQTGINRNKQAETGKNKNAGCTIGRNPR